MCTVFVKTRFHIMLISIRIAEITPNRVIDKRMSYDEYISDKQIRIVRESLYGEPVPTGSN